MQKLICPTCNNELKEMVDECPSCGTHLAYEKIETTTIEIKSFNEKYENPQNGTEQNINFHFKLANTVQYFFISLSVLILILGLFTLSSGEGAYLLALAILAVIIYAIGYAYKNLLNWRAYMLKNMYEINTNKTKNNK